MHQQSSISTPPINIYRPVPVRVPSPTLHISSPLSPPSPNRKILRRRRWRSESKLLNIDVSYAHLDKCVDQEDFLLVNPLHRYLFSQLTCHLLSVSLLVGMDNRRTRGVNITTLSSEILNIMASKVAKTSLTPLNDIVSLCRS
jgi:hypothetical protein